MITGSRLPSRLADLPQPTACPTFCANAKSYRAANRWPRSCVRVVSPEVWGGEVSGAGAACSGSLLFACERKLLPLNSLRLPLATVVSRINAHAKQALHRIEETAHRSSEFRTRSEEH